MSRPVSQEVEAAFLDCLRTTGNNTSAFLAGVAAYRNLHPALSWGAAALHVAHLLKDHFGDEAAAGVDHRGPPRRAADR